jgi:hypothetical protein
MRRICVKSSALLLRKIRAYLAAVRRANNLALSHPILAKIRLTQKFYYKNIMYK